MLHEVDERDPGAVVEGEAGGISGALRWIGQAVVFVRIESDGGMATPAVYSARVFARGVAVELEPFKVEDGRQHGNHAIDSPETFDAAAVAAIRMARADENKDGRVGAIGTATSPERCEDRHGYTYVRRCEEGDAEHVNGFAIRSKRLEAGA